MQMIVVTATATVQTIHNATYADGRTKNSNLLGKTRECVKVEGKESEFICIIVSAPETSCANVSLNSGS